VCFQTRVYPQARVLLCDTCVEGMTLWDTVLETMICTTSKMIQAIVSSTVSKSVHFQARVCVLLSALQGILSTKKRPGSVIACEHLRTYDTTTYLMPMTYSMPKITCLLHRNTKRGTPFYTACTFRVVPYVFFLFPKKVWHTDRHSLEQHQHKGRLS
jgi:hypothetical protein